MSAHDSYILEIAASLHDIGKIGVPDAVLSKPAKLTDKEWQVMAVHDRIGVEIVGSTFNCPELADAIRLHHNWFDGSSKSNENDPVGNDIPVAARILAIADAYDAMVSDRV